MRKTVRVLRGFHVDIRGSVLWTGKTQRHQRVCSKYREIPLIGLPGKVYSWVLERRV